VTCEISVSTDLRVDLALVTIEGELKRRIAAKRSRSAGNHCRRAGVAAHGINGNAWAPAHGPRQA
jgi:hypothetical protein